VSAQEVTAGTDSLRAVLDSVFAAPAYQWETREDPFGVLRRLWEGLGAWLYRLRADNPQAFQVLTWSLALLLAVLLGHAALVAYRTMRGRAYSEGEGVAGPLAPPRDAGWYGAEARRLAALGEFVPAMQADFIRLVLELDARRVVTYHPSRTPSEYARAPGLAPEGRQAMRELVRQLYAYAFARQPCDRVAFEAWQRQALADRYAAAH